MRILLTAAILIAFSSAAFAESGKIVVKNEDGTVSSIDIGPAPAEPEAPPPPSILRKHQSAAPPAPVAAKPDPVPAPVASAPAPAAAKPAKKPAPPKQAAATTPAPKKKPTPPPAKQKQAAPAKPVPAPAPDIVPTAAAPMQPRLGPNMTPEDAIRIALDAAPPARSVDAYPVNYKGLHAYQIVFDTEDGDRSLFVDRESGKLVK